MGRKAKPGSPIHYFTLDTQDAVIKYNNMEEGEERNQLFNEQIYKPLDKIAEYQINSKKLWHLANSFEDLKHEVVLHLMDKLPKYTVDKGKAFSYFTVIARNYLILKSRKFNKERDRRESLYWQYEDKENSIIMNEIEESLSDKIDTQRELEDFFNAFVEYLSNNRKVVTRNDTELKIVDALIQIFEYRDEIEIPNKKAVYVMIREQTNIPTHTITKTVKKLKQTFYRKYSEYLENGTLIYV